jgi:hypothetical protein
VIDVDNFEHSVQVKLRAEAQRVSFSDTQRSRVIDGLRENRCPRRIGRATVALTSVGVVAILAVGVMLGHLVSDSDSGTNQSPASGPSTQDVSPTNYGDAELSAVTERLLAASRSGDVPTITFVRDEPDRSGLIVAVSRDILDKYGEGRLAELFGQAAGLPVTIDVAEEPNDGLPIRPPDDSSRG